MAELKDMDGRIMVLMPRDMLRAVQRKAFEEDTKLSRLGRQLFAEWLGDSHWKEEDS